MTLLTLLLYRSDVRPDRHLNFIAVLAGSTET